MSLMLCSLFTGIGGMELAAGELGMKCQLLCDIDPAARAVLGAKFQGVEIAKDVNTLATLPERTDIVTAGFPCQNLSMAGDKSGIHGTKSGVVGKLFELLAARNVPFVVIENVPFMLHLAKGNGMRWLIESLEKLGYRWAYRTLDTMAFGLPQRRRRIYLLASKSIDPATVLFSRWHRLAEADELALDKPIGFYWTEGRSGIGLTQDGLPPIKAGSTVGIRSTPAVLLPDGTVRTPDIEACETLQGFPAGWTEAATELDPRGRWRLVGNSVSVPVAKWVLGQIGTPAGGLPDRKDLKEGSPWPANACGVAGKRWRVEMPADVAAEIRPSLASYEPTLWPRISYRALKGFHGRASGSGLKMPAGFLDAIAAELAALEK